VSFNSFGSQVHPLVQGNYRILMEGYVGGQWHSHEISMEGVGGALRAG